MPVFKIIGSILDLSPAVAEIATNQTRYIRALSVSDAKAIWERISGFPYWDKISLQVPGERSSQLIGFNSVYDRIAAPTHGDGIDDPLIDMADLYKRAHYRPTAKAEARNVTIKAARAQTGADKALAKLGRRIAALQKASGLQVNVRL